MLGAWPVLFNAPACDYVNRRVDLADLWDDTAALARCLRRVDDPQARLASLQAELRSRRLLIGVDQCVAELAQQLMSSRDRIATIAQRIGLSSRQLHRRCERALGYPPSELARLVRFQQFLEQMRTPGRSPRRLIDVAMACGYADHSHLTRDCRMLTGYRPSALDLTALR